MLEHANRPIQRAMTNKSSFIGSPPETDAQAAARNLIQSKQRLTQFAAGLACCLITTGYFIAIHTMDKTQKSDLPEEQPESHSLIYVGVRCLHVAGSALILDGLRPDGQPMIRPTMARLINKTSSFFRNVSEMIE